MQGRYRQNELGTFPAQEWKVWAHIICSNYEQSEPELWARAAMTHAPNFIKFVEACDAAELKTLPE
jgi:hypothetical protein